MSKEEQDMKKLTKREIILVYALLVVIIVAGGLFLLIKPAMERNDEAQMKLENAQLQQAQTDQLISQKSTMLLAIADQEREIKKLSKKFMPATPNEDLDNGITSMVINSGMSPEALQIGNVAKTDGTGATTDETLNIQGEAAAPTDEAAVDQGMATDTGETADMADAGVTMTTVTVSGTGMLNQFNRLIGLAKDKRGVVISGFTLSSQKEEENLILNPKKTKSGDYLAELTLSIYQRH